VRAETIAAPEEPDPPQRTLDWGEILNAMQREIEVARTMATGPGEVAVPDVPTQELKALPSIATEPPAPDTPTPVPPVQAAEAAPRRKPRRPRQDEWGFFDPDRCGVSALISKVNQTKGPKRSA
jgi:hypothetical protein